MMSSPGYGLRVGAVGRLQPRSVSMSAPSPKSTAMAVTAQLHTYTLREGLLNERVWR